MAHSKSEIRKAKNLLSKYAPKGEQLAYINSKEANLLKSKGGSGKMTIAGIKSYGPNDDDYSDDMQSGNYGGSDSNSNDNSPQRQPASFRSVAPKTAAKKSKSILDYSPTVQVVKFVFNKVKGVFEKNKEQNRRDKLTSQFKSEEGPIGSKNNNMGGGNNNMGGGGNNNPPARNVGGRILKLSPTSAEVSQSKATDVTYDSRKTKARGRSMTILTSAKGIGRNMGSVLGSKSLLGA